MPITGKKLIVSGFIVVPDDAFDTFTIYQKYTRLKNETKIQKLPKIVSSVDQYALRIKLTGT